MMDVPKALTGALKYIKKFKGKIFVIFVGKNAFLNEEIMSEICDEIALLKHVGINVVVIHEIPDSPEYFGDDKDFMYKFLNNERTRDMAMFSIAGKISLKFISCLAKQDITGISITEKNKEVINLLIRENFVPVISPVLVLDQYLFAAEIASDLKAEKFILMIEDEGILDADEELIPAINLKQLENLINEGVIADRLIAQINACKVALNSVNKAHIIKADKNKLIEEIFTDEGVGTIITKD